MALITSDCAPFRPTYVPTPKQETRDTRAARQQRRGTAEGGRSRIPPAPSPSRLPRRSAGADARRRSVHYQPSPRQQTHGSQHRPAARRQTLHTSHG